MVLGQDNSNKKFFRWWMIPVALIIFLLFAVALFRVSVSSQLENRIADFHAKGYPVTLEELDAWYPTPPDDNAADIYLQAFDAKPIKYKTTAKGFMLYSIGRDLTDNGGVDRRLYKDRIWREPGVDITFTVERQHNDN